MPNVLTCQVSKNIGICDKHFPPDCPRIKKPGGSLVPTVPPSIFGTTKSSLFVQTAFSPRVAVTAESRRSNEETRRLEADKIISFDKTFLSAFHQIYLYSGYHFPDVSKIIRILCNCFFKAFDKRVTDDAKTHNDQRETKKRRLSSR